MDNPEGRTRAKHPRYDTQNGLEKRKRGGYCVWERRTWREIAWRRSWRERWPTSSPRGSCRPSPTRPWWRMQQLPWRLDAPQMCATRQYKGRWWWCEWRRAADTQRDRLFDDARSCCLVTNARPSCRRGEAWPRAPPDKGRATGHSPIAPTGSRPTGCERLG